MADAKTTTTEMNIKGTNIFKIKLISAGLKWKKKDSKMLDLGIKTYNLYRYKGKAFACWDSEFIAAHKAENLNEVDLIVETIKEEGKDDIVQYSFGDFVTMSQVVKHKKAEFQMDLMNITTFTTNPELFSKMTDLDTLVEASTN